MTNRKRHHILKRCLLAVLFAILAAYGLYRLFIWYGVAFSIGI